MAAQSIRAVGVRCLRRRHLRVSGWKGVAMLASLVFAGVPAVSCGGGGGGSGTGALTKGAFCSRIGAAVCDRAVVCGLVTTSERSECLRMFQQGCCEEDSSCGDRVDESARAAMEEYLAECTQAFSTWACSELEKGNIPPECEDGNGQGDGGLVSESTVGGPPSESSIANTGSSIGTQLAPGR